MEYWGGCFFGQPCGYMNTQDTGQKVNEVESSGFRIQYAWPCSKRSAASRSFVVVERQFFGAIRPWCQLLCFRVSTTATSFFSPTPVHHHYFYKAMHIPELHALVSCDYNGRLQAISSGSQDITWPGLTQGPTDAQTVALHSCI